VKLKSMGRPALVKRKIDDQQFRGGDRRDEDKIAHGRHCRSAHSLGDSPVQAARSRGISVTRRKRLRRPSEINVIGHNVDDATREVEKFIDRAFLAGRNRVRIVHGSGMGILRKALRKYLQKHPQSLRFRSHR